MKEWFNKNKIVLIICAVIILIGLVMLFAKGFNKEGYYTANKKIEVYIEKGYEKEDIVNIAKESFPGREIIFEEVEKLTQVAAIRLKDATEEEIHEYEHKLLEKYEIAEEDFQIFEIDMPTTRIKTFIEPYSFSVILVTCLSLVYMVLRNIKNGKTIESVIKLIITLILAIGIYFSIILIFRMPFGTYTMPLALTVYTATLLASVYVIQKNNK